MTATAEAGKTTETQSVDVVKVDFFGLHSSVNVFDPAGLEGLEPAATGAGNHNNAGRSFCHTLEALAYWGRRVHTRARVVGIVGENDVDTFDPDRHYVATDYILVPGSTRVQQFTPGRSGVQTLRDTHYDLGSDPLAQFRAKMALVPGGRRLVFGGSVPPGFPDATPLYTELALTLCKRGVKILGDFRGRELKGVMIAVLEAGYRIDFKANEDELSELVGEKVDPLNLPKLLEYAKYFNPDGLVILSLGKNGTFFYNCGAAWLINVDLPEGERYIHPIGCGDTVVGASLACLTNDEEVEFAFRVAVAAAVAQLANPFPGFFRRELLEELLRMMEDDPACVRCVA